MPKSPHEAGQPAPPSCCDQCGAPLKLDRVVAHPDKPGHLHVYECTGCGLPIVQYVPR
jgi:hypothetical protein